MGDGVLVTIYLLTWVGTANACFTLKIILFFVTSQLNFLIILRATLETNIRGKKLKVKVLFLKQLINKMDSSVKSQNIKGVIKHFK